MDALPDNAFYRRQIACLEGNDLDGLMEQYHEDAVLLTFEPTGRGRDALRPHMAACLAHLGSPQLRSTDTLAASDDAILFEATVATDHGVARAYDAFALRDGKSTHHVAGVLSFTPDAE